MVVIGHAAHCLPRLVDICYLQKFLVHDCMGKSGIESLDVLPWRRNFTPGSQNSRTGDVASVDGVSQDNVAVNPGVPEVAYCREATLQVFARRLRAAQHALTGRHSDRQ